MFTWVIYDISHSPTRTRVSEDCKDYGLVRFQKSVFFGEATREVVERLADSIRHRMRENPENRESDSVLIFFLCTSCLENKIVIGKKFDEDDYRKRSVFIIG